MVSTYLISFISTSLMVLKFNAFFTYNNHHIHIKSTMLHQSKISHHIRINVEILNVDCDQNVRYEVTVNFYQARTVIKSKIFVQLGEDSHSGNKMLMKVSHSCTSKIKILSQ